MHFNRLNSKIYSLIAAILVLLLYGVPSTYANEPAAIESSKSLLKLLSAKDDPATTPLLNKWSDRLQSITTYSNLDYLEALTTLQKEYSDLIAQTEECMTSGPKDAPKGYDPVWIDKLISHFGMDFLKDKEKVVLTNLRMAVAGDTINYCGAIIEKLVYKEAVLFGAYRYYLSLFIDFYKSQPAEAKEVLRPRKDAAENFLNLINNYSFMKLFIGSGMPRKELSEIEAKNANEAIYNYFKENPVGYDADPFKVIEDFRKAIGKNE